MACLALCCVGCLTCSNDAHITRAHTHTHVHKQTQHDSTAVLHSLLMAVLAHTHAHAPTCSSASSAYVRCRRSLLEFTSSTSRSMSSSLVCGRGRHQHDAGSVKPTALVL